MIIGNDKELEKHVKERRQNSKKYEWSEPINIQQLLKVSSNLASDVDFKASTLGL